MLFRSSLALAIGFTGGGLALMDWSAPTRRRTLAAGLLIGSGVASMHFVGMAAMRSPTTLSYDPLWVAIAIAIAVVAATIAVWLATRDEQRGRRAAAAVMMGAAISGMHYAGMHAARFTRGGMQVDQASGLASFGQASLALAISFVTLLVLLLALAAVQIERMLRSAARDFSKPEWKIQDPQLPKSRWYHTDARFVGFRVVRPLGGEDIKFPKVEKSVTEKK